jgi:hypothetical protein
VLRGDFEPERIFVEPVLTRIDFDPVHVQKQPDDLVVTPTDQQVSREANSRLCPELQPFAMIEPVVSKQFAIRLTRIRE